MKKLLFVLSIIALPLNAIAADKPDKMSDSTIDAAVKKFGPSFCAKTVDGIKEAAEKVYDCYQKTPKDNPDLEICFLGDNAVYTIIERVRNKSNSLGKNDPFGHIIFFSEPEILKRVKELQIFSKYKNYTDEEKTKYQVKSIKDFINKANASCNPSH
ncbi:hypothetical protein [Commensalibacter communis]|uniref:hypothetical protein n=1 Tax=Commensalibacter communis TaxID=2972786 RepID=UPI0022FFBD53|nr:hypothetical protein [Commensalibacter communis]CAI3960694.1 unnamed protein product [Commensalibacter communis]